MSQHLAPTSVTQLRARVGASSLSVVGLWPEEAVTKKWELVTGGETLFFVTRTASVGTATIMHGERSRALAQQLFGRGAPGGHELLLFLVDAAPLQLPLATFNLALGRRPGSTFKNFTTIAREQIRKLEDAHGSLYGFLEAAKPKPADGGGGAT